MKQWLFLLAATLLVALYWITRVRAEAFIDLPTAEELPVFDPNDPSSGPEAFRKLRALMEKYDKPEIWSHINGVFGKDPGELARMHLNGLQKNVATQ
jgi:hypothetical protein